MSEKVSGNVTPAQHQAAEQALKNLIEEYKDVTFLNAGMAQSRDESFVSAEVYLRGDLLKKLDHAQAAQKTMAEFDDNPLDVNVIALERAIEIQNTFLQQDAAIEDVEPLPDFERSEFTPAKHLPEGWGWHDWPDGSGSLQSPTGERVLSYDLSASEYKIDGKWNFMEGYPHDVRFDREAWEIHFHVKLFVEQEAAIKAAYSHAYASCVTDNDTAFLDRIIENAADVKEPFVVVKGFVNHDFNVPKLKPMPFIEASERFKEMA